MLALSHKTNIYPQLSKMSERVFHITLPVEENNVCDEVYKLANYNSGGSLLETYRVKGEIALQHKLEELKRFMYFNGDGTSLKDLNTIQSSLNEDRKSDTFSRNICWKVKYRGVYGETLLHILISCNTQTHTFVAKLLLQKYTALVYDVFESEEYRGTSALHLAIANRNEDLIDLLLRLGADVNQRSDGTFFRGFASNNRKLRRFSSFGNYQLSMSYLGEYPLSWAVCINDKRIYNKLMAFGANPNLQDSFGNTVLHVIVTKGITQFYSFALSHTLGAANDHITNNDGLTPMALACTLGRSHIFNEIVEPQCFNIWIYSALVCCSYPLTLIDSIQITDNDNERSVKIGCDSALTLVLNGKCDDHIEMLRGGVIQKLLEEKWKTFGYTKYIRLLFRTLLYLCVLSVAIFLRTPNDCEESELLFYVRTSAEALTSLFCLLILLNFVIQILHNRTWNIRGQLNGRISKSAFFTSNLLIICCALFRIFNMKIFEEIFLILALPCSWFILIFFAGAIQLTGPFISMIRYMIVQDMRQFSLIYLVFLYGFSQAFHFLLKQPSRNDSKRSYYDSYEGSWMRLFKMTLGNHQFQEIQWSYYQWITKIFFVLFMILVPILLLNMLIAMMGNTYSTVISKSEREWNMQWAKIVLEIEKSLSKKEAFLFHKRYTTYFEERNVRALIVLKRMSKSVAKQRVDAINNWKRLKWRLKVYTRMQASDNLPNCQRSAI